MKLLMCTECWDVFKLINKKRYCRCKRSYGWTYGKFGVKSKFGGEGIPLGMSNYSLFLAEILHKRDTRTSFINTWTIDYSQPINDVKKIK